MGASRCLSQITLKTQIFWNCRIMRYCRQESGLPWTDKWNWNCLSLFITYTASVHSPLMCVKTKFFPLMAVTWKNWTWKRVLRVEAYVFVCSLRKKHKQLNTLAIDCLIQISFSVIVQNISFSLPLDLPSDHKVYRRKQTVSFNYLFTT